MSRAEFRESLVIIAAVVGLWPMVFGFREAWYMWGVMPALLLGMLLILRRRLQRMHKAFEETRRGMENQQSGTDPGMLPFASDSNKDDGEAN